MRRRGGAGAATIDAGDRVSERRTADTDASMLVAVRRGLGHLGYTKAAMSQSNTASRMVYERVSAQLTDLTQRKVGEIVLAGSSLPEELLHQVRASSIPIVVGDPVRFGLVARMNRPGGNVTGVNSLVQVSAGKHLGRHRSNQPHRAFRSSLLWEKRDPLAE